MRTGVDSLLGRIAEFAPLDPEEAEASAAWAGAAELRHTSEIETPAKIATPAKKPAKQSAGGTSPVKSVRIALARLDRMMNTVGELVINRTRMVGRVAELEKLVDTLASRKSGLQGKVAEIPRKNNEFNRISNNRTAKGPWNPERTPKMLTSAAAGDTSFWSNSAIGNGPLRRFQYIVAVDGRDFSGRQRGALATTRVYRSRRRRILTKFTKLAHHLQDEITAARMVPIGTLYSRLSRAVRDAANSTGKHVELDLSGSETELDNNIIQQISDPLVHLGTQLRGARHRAKRRPHRRRQVVHRECHVARLSSRQPYLHRSRR